MKKLSLITLLAALSLPVSGVALALDSTAKAGGNAAGSASTSGVDATTTASVSTDNYGTLISTLNAGKTSFDFSKIASDADITIVTLSSLKATGDAKALDNALEKNASAMTTLHASIEGSSMIKGKLDAQKFKVDDVVAVSTGVDGKVTVFVDDRA